MVTAFSRTIRNLFARSSAIGSAILLVGIWHSPIVIGRVLAVPTEAVPTEAVPTEAVPTGAAENNPQVCVGDFQAFSPELARGLQVKECPGGQAFYSAEMGGISRSADGSQVPISGSCCPLPARDILTSETVIVESECPDGFISTGLSATCPPGSINQDHQSCVKPLRCSRINAKRYQLGSEQPGRFWGFNTTYYQQGSQVMKGEVPLAIRYALGREEIYDWRDSGCVGYPFGSLLVKKSSKRCGGLGFRQLQYRGLSGDPPQGTPVPMFPQCKKLSNIFEQHAQCD